MRILFLRSDIDLAGPGIAALRLAEALQEQGHSVSIATSGGSMVKRFEEQGIAAHILPELAISNRSLTGTLRTMLSVRRLVRRHHIDVMHSFNAHAALTAELARRTTSAHLVHTVLGTGKEWMNRLHGASIAAVSGNTRARLIAAGIEPERVRVVHPLSVGVDYLLDGEQLMAVRQERATRPICRFVSVAMFTGGKGQEQLIERFALFAQRCEVPFELVLVGDGPSLADCEKRAARLGIAERVVFAGVHTDVRPLLDQADCFVHHAAAETFGMVMVEAGARRLPTVVADVGGISDIVIDGETGFLVDFDDEDGFVDALVRLVSSRELRERMGEAAFARVASQLVKGAILPGYLQLYEGG